MRSLFFSHLVEQYAVDLHTPHGVASALLQTVQRSFDILTLMQDLSLQEVSVLIVKV